VRDDGPGPSTGGRDGVGLRNTRSRLAELYGDRGRLTLEVHPQGGAVARVRLPYGPLAAS